MKHLSHFRAPWIRASLAALVLFVVASSRGEMPPALKPLADKFAADRAALTTAGEAQLKPARDHYLAALEAAQKVATAATKTADLAAIAAEIKSLPSGAVIEAFPPDLPRSLSQDRRAWVTAATNVARTIPPRQRDLAAKYLQALAGLEAGAAKSKDTALAEAVAAEKQRVSALVEAAGGGQKNRNIVANGDFSEGQPGALPPGWRPESTYTPITDAELIAEGTEKYLRFRRLEMTRTANLLPEKELVIPANAHSVEFSARIRVKGLVPGKESWDKYPGVHVSARDARNEEVGSEWASSKQDTSWKRFTGKLALPATAKTVRVNVGPQLAAGVVDFDDIVVEFR